VTAVAGEGSRASAASANREGAGVRNEPAHAAGGCGECAECEH
jgi:hypothetical protein